MTIKLSTSLNHFNLLHDSIQMMEEPVEQFEKGQLSDKWGEILLEDIEGLSCTLEKVNERLDYFKTVEFVYYGEKRRHRATTTMSMIYKIENLNARLEGAIYKRKDKQSLLEYNQSFLKKIIDFVDPFTSKFIYPIACKVDDLYCNFSEKIKNQIYSLIAP